MSEKLTLTRVHPLVEALSKESGCDLKTCMEALERFDWSYFAAACYLIELGFREPQSNLSC